MNLTRIFRRFSSNIKTALVTGATQDISRVCITRLLDNDVRNLIITDSDITEGKNLAYDLIRKYKKSIICFIRADLTVENQAHGLFRSIHNDFGPCDLVINSAAIYDEKQVDNMMKINMESVVNCTNSGIEYMSKSNGGSGGTIINVSSVLGLEPSAHAPMFSATKSFIIGLTKSYGQAGTYGQTGIRFMGFCPGMTVEELRQFNEKARMELAKFGKQKISFVGDCLIEMLRKGRNGSLWTSERGEIYEMNLPDEMYVKEAEKKAVSSNLL